MKIAIVSFPGSAGELDVLDALVSVGFKADQVVIVNESMTDLTEYAGVFIPGGASYMNAVRPGAVAKITPVAQAIKAYAETGKPIIGLGNGFQILTELAILPGGFLKNKTLKTVNGFTEIAVVNEQTLFTTVTGKTAPVKLPISHLYGQYTADENTINRLRENKQIVLTYASHNPNGSVANIAGIMNEVGNVIGLMPKPERAMDALLGSEAGRPFFDSFYQQVTKG